MLENGTACGSDYALAAVGAVESAYAIKNDLSTSDDSFITLSEE
jgi:hypothetical protein